MAPPQGEVPLAHRDALRGTGLLLRRGRSTRSSRSQTFSPNGMSVAKIGSHARMSQASGSSLSLNAAGSVSNQAFSAPGAGRTRPYSAIL
jgi:hypothetical protein